MAINATRPPPSSQPRHSKLVRLIAIVFLTLIILVGLTALIVWLIVRPKSLVYTLENSLINGFNTSKNHLNATFKFELRAYNPNSRVSLYYDKIDVYVIYDDVTLATQELSPFYQPRRNVTYLGANVVAREAELFSAVMRDLKLERTSGEVELSVKLKARVRFKVGIWKSGHRNLKVYCSPVLINFSSHRKFERTKCDVDV